MHQRADHDLFVKLLSVGLPAGGYAVFGSGPMYVWGLRESIHDVDVIARDDAWRKVVSMGDPVPTDSGLGRKVVLFDGSIEVYDAWGPGDWNVHELIDTAEMVDGLRFVSLRNVLRWKEIMGRDKDLRDAEVIRSFLGMAR